MDSVSQSLTVSPFLSSPSYSVSYTVCVTQTQHSTLATKLDTIHYTTVTTSPQLIVTINYQLLTNY